MSLVLTSLGMTTSVGHDVVTACASIRAGITRLAKITNFEALDLEKFELTPAIGHPIVGVTDGFSCMGRWQVMSQIAFADLLKFGDLPTKDDNVFWEKTGLLIVLPVLDNMRFLTATFCHPERIMKTFIEPFLEVVNLPIPKEYAQVAATGTVGTFQAINEARSLIERGLLKRIILLATDSYIDRLSMKWLSLLNRLKINENPEGLYPGEAACTILLEDEAAAIDRGATIISRIDGVTVKEEKDFPSQGRAMASAIQDVLRGSQRTQNRAFAGDLFINLNGENHRAYEFGAFQTLISHDIWGEYHLHTPAVEIGDTGAASGALGIVLAARSQQRGYAATDESLIVSASDEKEIAAAYISCAHFSE